MPTLIAFLRTLADVPSPDSVSFAICHGLLGSFRTDTSAIYAIDPEGRYLELLASYGAAPRLARIYHRLPLDMHIPVAEVALTGEERILTAKHVADEYPLTAPYYSTRPSNGEVAYLPLRYRGAVLGVVTLEFPDAVERTWELHEALTAMRDAVALWLLAYGWFERRGSGIPSTAMSVQPTDRQRQIVLLMRAGQSNRDIAEALGYSIATIKADITTMGAMLGAHGRAEILEKAERAGF